MTVRLVFIGECMVEMAPDGAQYRKGFAGDTFNMAWYARHLAPADWQVDFVSAIGADAISDEMAGFIAAQGIGTGHLFRKPDRSVGLYMISLKDGERSFSYWRSQSAARLLAEDPAVLASALKGADLVCFSGITLAILDGDGRNALAAALRDLRKAGGKIAFDPNIRPRLWANSSDMRDTIMRFAALSDVVLASFDDEAGHFGDADPQATVARYLTAGAGGVIVKNGPDPVVAVLGGAEVQVPTPSVGKITDSTAAGDSFNAGFLVSHLSGAPLSQAIAAGTALAGQVIQYPGALSRQAVDAVRAKG